MLKPQRSERVRQGYVEIDPWTGQPTSNINFNYKFFPSKEE